MGLSLPKTCCCISLRAASIIIGLIVFILGSMLFVNEVAFQIIYSRRMHSDADIRWRGIAQAITFLYSTSAQTIFSGMLMYGSIQEVSCYTLSWLICQLGIFVTSIVNILFTVFVSYYDFLEELIMTILQVMGVFVVYSYYEIMKKPVAS